jgi:outer membrane protein assembly factor BamB
MRGWSSDGKRWLPPAALLLLAGFACSDGRAPADNKAVRAWPMMGGTPSRNMVSAEKDLPAEWSIQEGAQKNIKWVAKIGTRGYMSPVVAGGKVYVSTNNGEPRDPKVKGDKAVLMCFRESDGKFLWQLTHDMPPAEVVREAAQDGLLSTPFIEGDRLYYVTPGAEAICADTDGKVVWRFDMMKDLKVFPCYVATCSPLVVGDLVFVVTGNGTDAENRLPEPKAPSFVALNKKTGQVQWKDGSPGDKIMEGQWTNPAYAEVGGKGQVIFPGGDGWLYSFEPATGKLIWKFDCNPKGSAFQKGSRGTRNYFLATPVVHDNKVYIGVGQNPENGPGVGHFWCIDVTKTGDVSPADNNLDPKAPANAKSALVWHYGGPIVPRPKTGRDIIFGRTVSTAAIHDGLVYVADLEGLVYCLDAKTGQKYWEYDLLANVWASPLYADGKVYMAADDGDVAVFEHGKTPPKPNGVRKNSMERPIKAGVVAVNGTLYVMTDGQLYAIAKK